MAKPIIIDEIQSWNNKEIWKNLDRILNSGNKRYNKELIAKVIDVIVDGKPLPAKYNQHKLKGKFKDCWECHITPDWLLIWQQKEKELILILTDTGTHSDLF